VIFDISTSLPRKSSPLD